ncbi:hypothetical protein M3J09_011240 [Ascochyta lentis]
MQAVHCSNGDAAFGRCSVKASSVKASSICRTAVSTSKTCIRSTAPSYIALNPGLLLECIQSPLHSSNWCTIVEDGRSGRLIY